MPALCRRVDALGGYAEVVSGVEYQMAERIGVTGGDIIFNGPYKTHEELLTAARNGSIVNLECDYEIGLVEAILEEHPKLTLRAGLRCAVQLEPGSSSRFGFDMDSPDFNRRVERLRGIRGLELVGLHCHSIPPQRSASNYGRIARRLAEMGREIWGSQGPAYIDMGGGFFSRMPPEMQSQFNEPAPSFEDYGAAITAPLLDVFGPEGGPELILEPGMAVVADALSFVCRVLECKNQHGRRLALAAGSVYNIRPTKSPRNLPLRVIEARRRGSAMPGPLDVVGYTCMEDDVLHRGLETALSPGDVLVFENCGSYSLVLKPPFIQGNVPVLVPGADGRSFQVVRRAETVDDILNACDVID
jgi:diaminopimelate decarboxylase